MKQEEIQRINQLARKSREEGLTEEERREQKRLREQYLADVRKTLRAPLECVRWEE